jgi:hypothetical protein
MESIRYENAISTWTPIHQASIPLNGVCFGDGNWLAVGPNNTVVRSEDLVSWTELQGAYPNATWNWIVAAPEPGKPFVSWRYVAVGQSITIDPMTRSEVHTGVTMYSDDGGLTWIKGGGGANANLRSIAYSPELNVYVAVGDKSMGPDGKYIPTILSVSGTA